MKRFFVAMGIFSTFLNPLFAGVPIKKWAVCYHTEIPVAAFKDYDMVVVDSTYPADRVQQLKDQGKEVFGYVSLGEIDSFRSYHSNFKPYYLGQNDLWSDAKKTASYVDPRGGDFAWPKYVLSTVLPDVYQKPFDGILYDTLDSVLKLEAGWAWCTASIQAYEIKLGKKWAAMSDDEKDGEKAEKFRIKYGKENLQGMTKAIVQLLYDIRAKFPDKKIFIYRAFSLFDRWDREAIFFPNELEVEFNRDAAKLANTLDYILLENVLTDLSNSDGVDALAGKAGAFFMRSGEAFDRDIELINVAKGFNPNLVFPALDYWDLNDEKGIKRVYAEARKRGWIPYVGDFPLMKVIPEPK